LLFDASIANQGRFPAIDFTLSISRVGHRTQNKPLRKLGAEIAVLLSNYLKTEQYAHLGAELTSDVRDLIKMGAQFMSFLTQIEEKYLPLSVQAVYAAMLWERWLLEQSNEEVTNYRDSLAEYYQKDPAVRKMIDEIAGAADLDKMLTKMKVKKQKILELCQSAP